MRPETAIVEIHRKYRVYTEFYANKAANKTIILVNGSLATTTSFAQTVRYLQPHFKVVLYDHPARADPQGRRGGNSAGADRAFRSQLRSGVLVGERLHVAGVGAKAAADRKGGDRLIRRADE